MSFPISLATTCKDHPVQLWDAFDFQMRASYSPHNELVCVCVCVCVFASMPLCVYVSSQLPSVVLLKDELVTPHSLCFSLNGQKLFCGFNKCVRLFETSRPGQDCITLPTHGQQYIISCMYCVCIVYVCM